MSNWQSTLVKRFRDNVVIKDDNTAIVNKATINETLIDKITRGINGYLIETMTPNGETKGTYPLISIYHYAQ